MKMRLLRGTKECAAALSALAGLSIVWALAGSSWAGGGVDLRYRFQPGATYDEVITMDVGMNVDAGGGASEGAPAPPEQGIQQKARISMVMEVGQREEDGGLPLTTTIGDVNASVTMGGQTTPLPGVGAAGQGTVIRARLAPDGRTVRLDKDAMAKLPQGVSDRMLSALPSLPEKPMAPGESFDMPLDFSMPAPMMGGSMEMEGKAVYTLKRVEGPSAYFDISQKFSLRMGGGAAESLGLHMNGEGTGTGVFDLEEGLFSSVNVDMSFVMEMSLAGGKQSPTGDSGAQAQGAIKVAAKGPVGITMKRRAGQAPAGQASPH